MKSVLFALTVALGLGAAGIAVAQDAMATPMQSDAMSGGEMMMTPGQMMAMCLEKAAMAADAMTKDEGAKACHTVQSLLMGDAMMSQPMGTDAMSGGAMAPAAQ